MPNSQRPRISAVHAYRHSLPPMDFAFETVWPAAEVLHLLDQSLYADLDDKGTITSELTRRLERLFEYAESYRADGIIFTGSIFASAVDMVRRSVSIPVLNATEAMIEEVMEIGGHVEVLCTEKRSIPVLRQQILDAAAKMNVDVTVGTTWVEGAQAALQRGSQEEHDRLIAAAVEQIAGDGIICLGQMSMAPAARLIPIRPGRPVLTSPTSAVRKMRRILLNE